MVALILVIISVTLKKVRIIGLSSMTRELESLIQEILKLIALEDSIGDEKVKAHICLSMKKLKNLKLNLNFHQKNKNPK